MRGNHPPLLPSYSLSFLWLEHRSLASHTTKKWVCYPLFFSLYPRYSVIKNSDFLKNVLNSIIFPNQAKISRKESKFPTLNTLLSSISLTSIDSISSIPLRTFNSYSCHWTYCFSLSYSIINFQNVYFHSEMNVPLLRYATTAIL